MLRRGLLLADNLPRLCIDETALQEIPDLKGWKVFLCGDPNLIRQVQRKTFMAGASMKDIHVDAFLPAGV